MRTSQNERRRTRRTRSTLIAVGLIGSLALAACGSDEDEADDDTSAPATAAATTAPGPASTGTGTASASTAAGATTTEEGTSPSAGGGGSIDCGNLFSTMSVITTENFVALEDDKTIVPNEAVVPLLTKDVATPELLGVIDGVSAALDTDGLKEMMVEIEVDKKGPDEVAQEFVDGLDEPDAVASAGTVIVGSADFPESQLLAEIYGQQLERAGYDVETKPNIGSREIYYKAISSSPAEINLVPEYTNSLLSYVLKQSGGTSPAATNVEEQITELQAALPETLTVGTPSTAEDKDVIVCTEAIANQYELRTLSDLAAVADKITLGAPPEFETRDPFGLVGFKRLYNATFKSFVPLKIGDVPAALLG